MVIVSEVRVEEEDAGRLVFVDPRLIDVVEGRRFGVGLSVSVVTNVAASR